MSNQNNPMLPIIVFPMAGLSQRFQDAGYSVPKCMLEAHGRSLFEHAVRSFENYFDRTKFVFIARDDKNTIEFVREQLDALNIADHCLVVLDNPTKGQAETVLIGLERLNIKPEISILVFNIDSFRHQFELPSNWVHWDGYLEVFEGEGDHWSFALPADDGSSKVAKTTEKERISNLCSTGLYVFREYGLFRKAYEHFELEHIADQNERYIAPLYNYLIELGLNIHYHKINESEVSFCGTPIEYEQFLAI